MRRIAVPETVCSWCDAPITRATDAQGIASPSPGDLSVCVKCAGLLRYGEKLSVKKLEVHELLQVYQEDPAIYVELMRYQGAVRQVLSGKRRKGKRQ